MPTIVDSFVVSLGLDPRAFNAGQKDAINRFKKTREEAHKTANLMEEDGKRAAKFFSQVKGEALALGTVLFGGVGLAEFIKGTIDGNAAVVRFADNIGTTTENLSAWEGVMKNVGGTADDAAKSLGNLSSVYQNYLIGRAPSADFIQGLNLLRQETGASIGMHDFADPTQAALKMAEAASKLSKPRANTILGMLGQSPAMINFLEQGPEKVNAQLAESTRLTRVQGEAAEKTQAELGKVTQKFQTLANELLTDFLPAMDKTLDLLAKGLDLLKSENDRLGSDKDKHDKAHVRTADDRTSDAVWNYTFGRFLGYRGNGGPGNWGGDPVGTVGSPVDNGQTTHPAAPPASAPRTAAPAATGAAGDQARAALRGAGFSADQAAGITAWLQAESHFNTKAFNKAGGGHGAYGIGQWRGDRQKRLFAMFGPNPGLAEQIQYLIWELTHTEAGAAKGIRGAGSSAEALALTATLFGRGSASDNAGDYRRGLAYLSGGGRSAKGGNMTTVQIDNINITSPNADPKAVAGEIPGAINRRFGNAVQANEGLF